MIVRLKECNMIYHCTFEGMHVDGTANGVHMISC